VNAEGFYLIIPQITLDEIVLGLYQWA